MSKRRRLLALLLTLTTILTTAGCGKEQSIENENEYITSIENFDNSNLDLYQIIKIDYNNKEQYVLSKLYTTPYSPIIEYKIIGQIKVVYEIDRKTSTMTSYYDILDIYSLADYLPEEEKELLGKISDDEVINLYFERFLNREEKKLVKTY